MAAQEHTPGATGEIAQKRPTLWSLSSDEEMLEAVVSDAETDEDAREMAQRFLNDIREDLLAKVDGYAEVITLLKARAQARKERADQMAELAKTDANRAKSMVATLTEWWRQSGITKPLQTIIVIDEHIPTRSRWRLKRISSPDVTVSGACLVIRTTVWPRFATYWTMIQLKSIPTLPPAGRYPRSQASSTRSPIWRLRKN